MVSSCERRWKSTCSAYSTSWGYKQGQDIVPADERTCGERVEVEDEREVAKRVLEDLEELHFDGDGFDDEDDEDDVDELDANTECRSDSTNSSRTIKRFRYEMTLEELSVAVNASIEHHLIVRSGKLERDKKTKQSNHHSDKSQLWPHHQHQCKSRPYQRSEFSLEMFKDMLVRKERHFYDMRATESPLRCEVKENQVHIFAASRAPIGTQHQMTSVNTRGQSIETDNSFHYQTPDATTSLAAASFNSLSQSPPLSMGSARATTLNHLTHDRAGPTLADLPKHRRSFSTRSQFSRDSFLASDSGSSSYSSPKDSVDERPSHYSLSEFAAEQSCSRRSSTRTESRNQQSSDCSKMSGTASSILSPPSWQSNCHQEGRITKELTPVTWELDLSNFTW